MSDTIVITRPKADSRKIAKSLSRNGFNCIIEPIISIKILYENAPALEYALERKPQIILATSKHAVSALARITINRSVPILTVGRVTADHALKLGFYNVSFAGGTANNLINYVEGNYLPDNGAILYIRGVEISKDIAGNLRNSGFEVDSVTVYHAMKARKLSPALCQAVLENQVNAVMFFSQNTSDTYAKLAIGCKISEAHKSITAICLSREIAEKTSSLLNWKDVMLLDKYFNNSSIVLK